VPDRSNQSTAILLEIPHIGGAQKIPLAAREKNLPGQICRLLFETALRHFVV